MKKHTALRPSGYTIITMPGAANEEYDTVQCVHCGGHQAINPAYAKGGWCFQCNGYICSKKCAEACVPEEQLLENIEKGRDWGYRPTTVSMSAPRQSTLVVVGS